ncbi:MAG: phosphoribosylamine--glycine ligase [Bacillota bacterium]|nr:MAG: phosphoribosylamine--glycine ligase [Bacillota bacterium]
MKVLVVGGGGREHALAWKLAQSPRVRELHAAPGNAGIARIATCHPVAATDLPGQVRLARELGVDLVVVGPDDPLALGLVDLLQAEGIRAFGPTRAAARLEASKSFAKEVMRDAGVPTADYAVFTDYEAALAHVRARGGEVVVKADGLALGKGVFVCASVAEAEAALRALMVDRAFGAAGAKVVIEEKLTGPECSVLALCDGEDFVAFPAVQDHKRLGEGDTGPNTGGMGTYTPVPGYTEAVAREVAERILAPTLAAMRERGHPFRGCLFAGLMLTADGPKVLEFNARFGDPEAQVALPMLDMDLLDLMEAALEGGLRGVRLRWRPGAAACVVAASAGYPGAYEKGKVIRGLEEAETRGALVFHAGTARQGDQVVTAGGRVLGVVGRGPDLRAALGQAYRALEAIHFDGIYYRKDIGWRAL